MAAEAVHNERGANTSRACRAVSVPGNCERVLPRKGKRGRRRKGYSMGRYPFLAKVSEYAEKVKAYWAETTCFENIRKLKYIGRQFEQMREKGSIRTSDPRYIREPEIEQYLIWMKEKGLQLDTMATHIKVLKGFLHFCNNATIDRMKMQHSLQLPQMGSRKEIKTMVDEDVNRIFMACDTIPGWRGEVARFIFPFYAYTGTRHSELRLAHKEDLNTTTWTFWVRNPKCKTRGAPERTVLIPPPLRTITQDFLTARAEWLKDQGFEDATPLIPSTPTKRTGYVPSFYTHNGFEVLKLEVEQLSGVKFQIKDFRSTFAQSSKDRGVSIEVVSKALGHASTKTTESFYARIRDRDALRELEDAWSLPIGSYASKNPKLKVL